jgi:DNA repair protein SbcC/Rad50
MRLHHLEVTAFGPFPGTESVDFDTLSDAGLFLLSGPTGAGKTSVLDAVCFGLYGEVPGDRNTAKRLRSDHAPAGVTPEVLLEVSIGGRRFRIHRRPAWQRPKRRGTGTTTENPKVTLEESVAGDWVHLSSRLDETGQVLTGLLGMNAAQFCQVAMLPQGRFQTFLRARSEERHKVLQQLFRSSRFEDVERWLVNRRQSLKSDNAAHQDAVAAVLSRILEVAAAELAQGWDLHDLEVPAQSGLLGPWVEELVNAACTEALAAAEQLVSSSQDAEGARSALQRARSVTDAQDRYAQAAATEATLGEGEADAAAALARLDAARRAASTAPLQRVAVEAAHQAETTQARLARALGDAAQRLGADALALTHTDLLTAEKQAEEAAAIAKALLPREEELRRTRTRLETCTAALADLQDVAAALDDRCAALPHELQATRAHAVELQVLASRVPVLETRQHQLVGQRDAAARVTAIAAELGEARSRHRASVDTAQHLREVMHQIREARINGMAAELAVSLAGGVGCPVCGSAEHPAPARPVDGAPDQAAESRAREAYEDADFTRQASAEAVRGLEHSLAVAEQSTGGRTVEQLEDELRRVQEDLASSTLAATEHEEACRVVTALQEELEAALVERAGTSAEIARLDANRQHAQDTAEALTAELAALFADEDVADSVARLVEARSAAGAAFSSAREALTAHDATVEKAHDAQRRADECAVEHGFGSVEEACRAALAGEDIAALEEQLRHRVELATRVETVLADPGVLAAVAAGPQDVAALEASAAAAEEAHAWAGARARLTETQAGRLRELSEELGEELARWAPTSAAYAVARAVSTFAEGKGGDNALQMRLSAYVLAFRLQQVVAAANERLRTMTDQRYSLEHCATRGAGELRGGLSLLVRDEWTGESRDPATLSGGETFVASLALALGLADVVTGEAGGSNIDTLFIDEGFGTLDPETLDDVMTTLDALRDGGRVVGIVSHVPEMRARVGAQLQIRKGRCGSSVVAVRESV